MEMWFCADGFASVLKMFLVMEKFPLIHHSFLVVQESDYRRVWEQIAATHS